MIRALILFLAVAFGTSPLRADPPAPPPTPSPYPWTDGESLTYLVSWGALDAAEGTFTAHDKGDHWEFDLDLASRGTVNAMYPFTAHFWSLVSKSTWRSIEYGEYRFEPKRNIKERTQVNYAQHQATREVWSEGKTKTFPIAEDSVDDVCSMLYHLRTPPWKPGDKSTLYVYESDSEKQGSVECQAREKRSFGSWPLMTLVRIMALPTIGTHHKGHLMNWMTDDAHHIPIHAELEFRYGTFDIDLVRTDKTLPIGH